MDFIGCMELDWIKVGIVVSLEQDGQSRLNLTPFCVKLVCVPVFSKGFYKVGGPWGVRRHAPQEEKYILL